MPGYVSHGMIIQRSSVETAPSTSTFHLAIASCRKSSESSFPLIPAEASGLVYIPDVIRNFRLVVSDVCGTATGTSSHVYHVHAVCSLNKNDCLYILSSSAYYSKYGGPSSLRTVIYASSAVIKTLYTHGKRKAKKLKNGDEKEEATDDIFFDECASLQSAFLLIDVF